MKSTLIVPFLLIIICSNFVLSQHYPPEFNTIQFNAKSTVVVSCTKTGQKYFIRGRTYSILPSKEIKTDTLSLSTVKDAILNYEINMPSNAELYINNSLHLSLFLVPNDTFFVSLDFSDTNKILQKVKVHGKCASINEYELRKEEVFGDNLNNRKRSLYNSELSFSVYKDSMDSINKIELKFLDSYNKTNNLPEWFRIYETNKINYYTASNKLNRQLYFNFMNKEVIIKPDYYDFLNKIKIDNKDAIFNLEYYNFLEDYFYLTMCPDSIKQLKVGNERTEKLVAFDMHKADSLLTGEVRDIYKSRQIQLLIIVGIMQFADSTISEQKDKIQPKYLKFLREFYNSKHIFTMGSKAPDFYLPDQKDKYISLSDYKGKVVLLNLWFPGCGPCRKEIPFEKELVEEFKSEDFSLINICVVTPKEVWLKSIDELGMEGINLFANERWSTILNKSYDFQGAPHYALIDKNGNIVSNNPKRPSNGLAKDIRELLNK